MAEDVKERIVKYLENCRACTVATATKDGEPSIATVFCKSEGVNIYFNTGRDSEKVKNLHTNPRLAIALQEEGTIPKEDRFITGIQYLGRAEIVAEKDYGEVPKAVMARHNVFNSIKPGNSVIIKTTPTKIYLIDYSRGFRHRDVLEFRFFQGYRLRPLKWENR